MKLKVNLYVSAGAVLVIGAFVSLLLLIRIDSWLESLLIGYFYALVLVASLHLVMRYVISKITIFSTVQQWLIRSLVYVITISFAYLLGLMFQTFVLTPFEQIQEIVLNRFWATFVQLVSLPFDLALSQLLPESQQPIILTFFTILIFIGIISLLGSYVELKWRENKQKLLRDRAELLALKSQIEPHFLFNSLNTIASLIASDPQKSEQLLIQLSEFLQYMSYNARKVCVPLGDEISFSKKYCNLLLARFDNLLEISWNENFRQNNFLVPVLIIQPLIENCVRHGWGDRTRALKIKITIDDFDNYLLICVSDNGQGIPARILEKLPGSNHALANIAERLQLMYKKPNLLVLESEVNLGTAAKITIPENCHA